MQMYINAFQFFFHSISFFTRFSSALFRVHIYMFNLIPSNGKHVAATAHSTHSLWMTCCMILFFARSLPFHLSCVSNAKNKSHTALQRHIPSSYIHNYGEGMRCEARQKKCMRMVAAEAPLRLKEIVNASWRWCLASVFAHSASAHACMQMSDALAIHVEIMRACRALRVASGNGVDARHCATEGKLK